MNYPFPQAVFDLHLHTHWSYDATASVEQHFRQAAELGLRGMAITEHQTMDSFAEVRQMALRYPGVSYTPAAEMTVSSPLGTFDMVCLNLPLEPPAELEAVFAEYRSWQVDIGEAYSALYTSRGIPFTRGVRRQILQMYRPAAAMARQGITHVQNGLRRRTLLLNGWVASEEALNALDADLVKEPLYRPYPVYERVLPVIRRCGGVIFIAHPQGYFRRDDRQRMDALREMLGFDGIECAHPSVDPELTQFYRSYCHEHKLLCSGGSDVHWAPALVTLLSSERSFFARHHGLESDFAALSERVRFYRGGEGAAV